MYAETSHLIKVSGGQADVPPLYCLPNDLLHSCGKFEIVSFWSCFRPNKSCCGSVCNLEALGDHLHKLQTCGISKQNTNNELEGTLTDTLTFYFVLHLRKWPHFCILASWIIITRICSLGKSFLPCDKKVTGHLDEIKDQMLLLNVC